MTNKKTDTKPFWQSDDPLVYYRDDGPLVAHGRHCVMSGAWVFSRHDTEHAARSRVDNILLAVAAT